MGSTLLPPTSPELVRDDVHPYFLWWTNVTAGELRRFLRSEDAGERAYWMGALLREANSRDVWLFVSPDEIRANWTGLIRFLGKPRDRWAWLLGFPRPIWPPEEARRG